LDLDAVWGGEWGRSSRDVFIRWGGDRRGKGQFFWVNVGRPIVTNGNLLRSCAKVRESIELSFGVVSRVSLGIRLLDVGADATIGRKGFLGEGGFGPIAFHGVFFKQKCIQLVHEKLRIFPYRQ